MYFLLGCDSFFLEIIQNFLAQWSGMLFNILDMWSSGQTSNDSEIFWGMERHPKYWFLFSADLHKSSSLLPKLSVVSEQEKSIRSLPPIHTPNQMVCGISEQLQSCSRELGSAALLTPSLVSGQRYCHAGVAWAILVGKENFLHIHTRKSGPKRLNF